MEKGYFIPKDFLKIKELNHTEYIVLAIYKYYTEKGKYKCCSLTCEQIADELNMSVWYLKKIKKHLKDLGFIRTDGGIKVYYLGVKGCTIVHSGGVPEYTGGVPEYSQECTIVHPKSVPEYTHNKEKKENKEIKKEEKRKMTNFDILISKLPDDYKTQEKIDYLRNNFLDKINQVDFNEGGTLDSWLTGIKVELNKRFPMEFIIEKKEPVSDTIDLF